MRDATKIVSAFLDFPPSLSTFKLLYCTILHVGIDDITLNNNINTTTAPTTNRSAHHG